MDDLMVLLGCSQPTTRIITPLNKTLDSTSSSIDRFMAPLSCCCPPRSGCCSLQVERRRIQQVTQSTRAVITYAIDEECRRPAYAASDAAHKIFSPSRSISAGL